MSDKHGHPHDSDCDDEGDPVFGVLYDMFEWQQASFRWLVGFLNDWREEINKEKTCSGGQDRDLNAYVAAVEGRRSLQVVNKFMIPDLFDVNSQIVSVMPRLKKKEGQTKGDIDVNATGVAWASNKPDIAPVEPMDAFDFDDSEAKDGSNIVHCPAGFRALIKTPLERGEGIVISATCSGYDKSESNPFNYGPGAERNLNAGVGDTLLDPEG